MEKESGMAPGSFFNSITNTLRLGIIQTSFAFCPRLAVFFNFVTNTRRLGIIQISFAFCSRLAVFFIIAYFIRSMRKIYILAFSSFPSPLFSPENRMNEKYENSNCMPFYRSSHGRERLSPFGPTVRTDGKGNANCKATDERVRKYCGLSASFYPERGNRDSPLFKMEPYGRGAL